MLVQFPHVMKTCPCPIQFCKRVVTRKRVVARKRVVTRKRVVAKIRVVAKKRVVAKENFLGSQSFHLLLCLLIKFYNIFGNGKIDNFNYITACGTGKKS